jgi:protein-tyrosine phosphatase
VRLLVVCLGNICRSPMAEGALRTRIDRAGLSDVIEVDSAGTGGWHAGEPADRRAIRCAQGHGVDISGLRARQVRTQDFETFDWLLCADAGNRRDLLRITPPAHQHKLALWLPWAGIEERTDIPDPYTGGPDDFERVWRLVDAAAVASVGRIAANRA